MKFQKFTANGNDFILLREAPPAESKLPKIIKALCDRKNGVGADGLIYLWKDPKLSKFRWRYFNSDASETLLCGNGARVVGQVLRNAFPKKKEWQWQGGLGLFRAKAFQKGVQVQWPMENFKKMELGPNLSEALGGFNDRGLAFAAHYNVGNPQLLLINHEIWSPQDRMANNRILRFHEDLGTEGANVTWLSLKDMSCVTFERGVEAETLACGSGALAAFIGLRAFKEEFEKQKINSATLHFPGGPLTLSHNKNGFWLGGWVKKSFEGKTHEI